MEQLQEGKVAAVTGAARGIGRAIALGLAEEGARVVIFDLLPEAENTAAAIRMLGRESLALTVDVADAERVREAVARAVEALGTIDILVNNAAITTNVAPVRKMDLAGWNREVGVNLTGGFNCIQAVLDGMVAKAWGRIVNISSGAAVMGGAGQASYVASKAGLAGLTKTVALEHARDGITCNVIYPGLIKSAASDAIRPDIRDRIIRRIPVRRLGEPRDIANAVSFLASDRAGYINGAELFIDAGMRLFTF